MELTPQELSDLCMKLVTGLKDEELPALLMREDTLLALLPEQLDPRDEAGRGDEGLERGRLLAEVFGKVTAVGNAEVRLRQARDLLGLSRSDPGFGERLKAADPRTSPAARRTPGRPQYRSPCRPCRAAGWAGSAHRTTRRGRHLACTADRGGCVPARRGGRPGAGRRT